MTVRTYETFVDFYMSSGKAEYLCWASVLFHTNTRCRIQLVSSDSSNLTQILRIMQEYHVCLPGKGIDLEKMQATICAVSVV